MSRRNQAKAFREVGLPLLLLVGGGFYGLTYFLEGLFEIKVNQKTCNDLRCRCDPDCALRLSARCRVPKTKP